jgi:shikimate kinase
MVESDCGEFAAVYIPLSSRCNAAKVEKSDWPRKIMPSAEPLKVPRTIVLIGLMGAGKSCIGRRLATLLDLKFTDADTEVERAAGCTIEEIFERHGETAFRDGERRVIQRLLGQAVQVLATGGGSFMDPKTRAAIHEQGISVWLRADLDLLLKRTGRRNNRPLLKRGDPRAILEGLIAERHPVYGEANVVVDSVDGPPEVTVERVRAAVEDYVASQSGPMTQEVGR